MSDTLYENNTAYTADWSFGTANWVAQTFTIGTVGAAETHILTSIKAYLYRNGLPGVLTVHIRNTDGTGAPTGSDLAAGTYDGDTLPLAIDWVEIPTPHVLLYSGMKYALVISTAANFIYWGYGTLNPYAGGDMYYSINSGATWLTAGVTNRDLDFYEYGLPASQDMILTGNATFA